MVIDMHPGIAALCLVLIAYLIHRATRRPPPSYNPDDFKEF
jgi:hypothetical protein